jgi:FKBP-type peptidyl-prolyl cis-trans isomerase FkpA
MKKFLPLLLILSLIVLGCGGKKQTDQSGTDAGKAEGQTEERAKSPDMPTESSAPVVTTEGGVQVQDIKEGTGDMAEAGKSVSVHYTGWLIDGKKFDSSIDRNSPFSFKLGTGQVIKGWDEGVAGMKVGGIRKLTIPPDMGYGDKGAGGRIPPGATLIFQVDLLEVK